MFGSIIVISLLSSVGWDASALLRVGEDNPAILSYVEEQLDHVRPVAPSGHDGKFYFIQAHDPFLLDPGEHASIIDRPVYRSQRMLYPSLASAGGMLAGWDVVWGLIVVNLLAIALGTWAVSNLAGELGASPWWGLAFALNPGVLFELIIDGAGALGWALAALGVLLVVREKYVGGMLAVTGAVLAREAMILVAIGLAIRLWKTERPRAIALVLAPVLTAAAWALWVRTRLDAPLLTTQSQELGAPFVGLARALPGWFEEPGLNLLFGLVVLALLLVASFQAVQRPSMLTWSSIGFVVLAFFLTRQVWLNYFDITRAIAPVFTTFVLAIFDTGSKTPKVGPPGD